jgi:hypothetical protein
MVTRRWFINCMKHFPRSLKYIFVAIVNDDIPISPANANPEMGLGWVTGVYSVT